MNKKNSIEERTQIIKTLNLLMDGRSGIFEIRIPNTRKGTVSGYYDTQNIEKASFDVLEFDGLANIYILLNELDPALIARSYNCLKNYTKQTTSDKDIKRRRWLLIDFDPKRPAGISSTNDEKLAAEKTMREVIHFLADYDWEPRFYGNSGNGYHIIYRIDLPNNQENTSLVKNVLEVINMMFSNDQVDIDTSVYKPSQPTKLYGTLAVKGDNTLERPHRRSKLHELDYRNEVSIQQLQDLASMLPKEEHSTDKKPFNKNSKVNIEDFCNQNGLTISKVKDWNGKFLYVLDECPFDPDHRGSHIIEWPNGNISFGCFHNSCQDNKWQDVLKLYGLMVGKKDKSIEKQDNTGNKLVSLVLEEHEFIRGDMGIVWVKCPGVPGVIEITSEEYKNNLTIRAYEIDNKLPSKDSIDRVVHLLGALANKQGPKKKIWLRTARDADSIYYNLANELGEVVQITKDGWNIISDPPVLFKNIPNSRPQLIPKVAKAKSIYKLFNFINLTDPKQQLLLCVSLVSCLIPDIPHPMLLFHGEKGAAKSTSMRLIKKLIDPTSIELLAIPSAYDNLLLTLSNNYAVFFDNINHLNTDHSDIFSRAVTGSGIQKRKLFTDTNEISLELQCCIAMNGINTVSTRPDFLDRSILFELKRIRPEERRTELDVNEAFRKVQPNILGAIFTILADAISIFPTVDLNHLPRMADFATWGYAIAEAMDGEGDNFLEALDMNQVAVNMETVTNDPVAEAIIKFMDDKHEWKGTMASLYNKLSSMAGASTKSTRWPKGNNILPKRLKEIKSNLAEIGINYETERTLKNASSITIINNNVAEGDWE